MYPVIPKYTYKHMCIYHFMEEIFTHIYETSTWGNNNHSEYNGSSGGGEIKKNKENEKVKKNKKVKKNEKDKKNKKKIS